MTRYEDYEDAPDYLDTDDYDELTEWSTLPDHIWSPYSVRKYVALDDLYDIEARR